MNENIIEKIQCGNGTINIVKSRNEYSVHYIDDLHKLIAKLLIEEYIQKNPR